MATETTVDLLRHGEIAGGAKLRGARTDDPLSPDGWAALERAVQGAGTWDVVISSPLARCRAYADTFSATVRMDVDARLSEYDFGEWDGRTLDVLWAEQGDALAAFLDDPERVTPPGGETAADFRSRVRAAWEDLVDREAGQRILVIAHGGVLRQWVADALGAPMAAHARLEWPPAAMSRLRVYDDPPYPRATSLAFHARLFGTTDEHG